jgi:hypothetical protein
VVAVRVNHLDHSLPQGLLRAVTWGCRLRGELCQQSSVRGELCQHHSGCRVNSDRRFLAPWTPGGEGLRRVPRLAVPKPYSTMVGRRSSRPQAITYEGHRRPMG